MPTAAKLGISSVEDLVRDVYLLDVEKRGDELSFLCPVHDDHNPSASVNTTTGFWSCWSCQAKGDLLSLGAVVLHKDRHDVEGILTPGDPENRRLAILRVLAAKKITHHGRQTVETSDDLPPIGSYEEGPLDYMKARGFSENILGRFQIRYARRAEVKTKRDKILYLAHVVAIPLFDENGTLVSWCYRSTPASPAWQPRYYYTHGTTTSDLLFGHHLCRDKTHVSVTEGPLDAMWVTQAGYQTVAVLGAANGCSPRKVGKLAGYERVTLFGDRDQAGINFVSSLGTLLQSQTLCYIARYRKAWQGKDPNELTLAQTRKALERAIPFHTWVLQERLRQRV